MDLIQEYLPQVLTLVLTVAFVIKSLSPLTVLVNKLVKGKADKDDLFALYEGIKEIVELEEVRALREMTNPVISDEHKEMYKQLLDKYKDNKDKLQSELEKLKG